MDLVPIQVKNAETMMTRLDPEPDGILVTFADGKRGFLPYRDVKNLDSSGITALDLPNPFELEIHVSSGEAIELPWDFIRYYCDPSYGPMMQREAQVGRLTLGNRVKRFRNEERLTQEELAQHAGVAQHMVSRIENGEESPRLETLKRLAAALGRSVEDLLLSGGSETDEQRS